MDGRISPVVNELNRVNISFSKGGHSDTLIAYRKSENYTEAVTNKKHIENHNTSTVFEGAAIIYWKLKHVLWHHPCPHLQQWASGSNI